MPYRRWGFSLCRWRLLVVNNLNHAPLETQNEGPRNNVMEVLQHRPRKYVARRIHQGISHGLELFQPTYPETQVVAILHLSHSAPRGSNDRNTTAKLIAGVCNFIKTQRPVPQTRHFLSLQHESGADPTSLAYISDMCDLSRSSVVLVAISGKPRDGTLNSIVICISYTGTF